MTQTLKIDAPRPLTDDEVRRVQFYVGTLFDKPQQVADASPLRKFDFAALDALFDGRRIGGEKSSVELVHEAMRAWADEVDRTS